MPADLEEAEPGATSPAWASVASTPPIENRIRILYNPDQRFVHFVVISMLALGAYIVGVIHPAASIVKDLELHGFGDVTPDGPEVFDEVLVERGLALEDVSERAGVPLEALEDLNPHLIASGVPEDSEYSVRVPVGAGERVAEALNRQ